MNAPTKSPAAAPRVSKLPSPEELPGVDVVIYDGDCKFCTAQVQRLAKFDGKRRLAFLSLHDPSVAKNYPDLTYDMLMDQMYVVNPKGGRHAGAAAFRYLSRRLPKLWLLAPLMHIPGSLPLWQWGYRQIAKRRYLMGKTGEACDGDACKVHFK
jgi:predicted DCC family thiol-disulfide oxidoreductase YuxK